MAFVQCCSCSQLSYPFPLLLLPYISITPPFFTPFLPCTHSSFCSRGGKGHSMLERAMFSVWQVWLWSLTGLSLSLCWLLLQSCGMLWRLTAPQPQADSAPDYLYLKDLSIQEVSIHVHAFQLSLDPPRNTFFPTPIVDRKALDATEVPSVD